MQHDYYKALAVSTHEIYKQLFPKRGSIYVQDSRPNFDKQYPVAVERPYYLVFAEPRKIPKDKLTTTTQFLSDLFKYDDKQKKELIEKLSKQDDPYEPISDKVESDVVEKLKVANLGGINYVIRNYRYYPEGNTFSNLLGFVGSDIDGNFIGRYGIEGGWNKELSGISGYLSGQQGAIGGLISTAAKTTQESEDGVDLVLTIDRSLQNKACEELKNGVISYKAKSGAIILLNSKTGAVLAMCSYPDFDPNKYYEATDARAYNNTNIFTAYEPGSVFKPITMSIGLDLDLVSPSTIFHDPGVRFIDGYGVYK